MSTIWRPVQFRIFNTQLGPLLTNVEVNHRHADPATEMYWGTTEFGVMDATAADQGLFSRARALGYSIYPGRRLGFTPNSNAHDLYPAKYWDPTFWQAETTLLESQIAMMEDDFRLMLDLEIYAKQGRGPARSHFTAGNSQWGTLDQLLQAMAPYLQLITVNNIIPLLHPVNLNSVLFTEIADAARGEICAQFENTFGDERRIYSDAAAWINNRHTTESQFIAPLRRRYPRARISCAYFDTIIRKYWFNRLAQLSSVQDGHVFIDDQYKLDWSQLGEQSFFDCIPPSPPTPHPPYNMNEGVVEAYHFRGDTQHLSDVVMRGVKRANVAVGMEDRKQLASRTDIKYSHVESATLESGGSTYLINSAPPINRAPLINSGPPAVGLGYERALYKPGPGSGYSPVAFDVLPFTILLDFYLHDLSGLHNPFLQRNPLLAIWGTAPHKRWFRVFWQPPNEYVFQVVEELARGSAAVPQSQQVVVDAGPKDSRRRRLQIASTENQIQIWNDPILPPTDPPTPPSDWRGATQTRPYSFPVNLTQQLTINFELLPDEGKFYYTRGVAYDQLVVWDKALTKVPNGNYPFMERQA